MPQDSMIFYVAVPLALVVALAAAWRVLRLRGRSESIRLNFDTLEGREMDKHLLALLVVLSFLVGAAHAQASGLGQPNPPVVKGAATIMDNYDNHVDYITRGCDDE